MFFNTWSDLLRIVAVGAPAYVALLILLRLSGKRTLSKLNAFDLVITVAFGSCLASALLDRSLTLAEIVTAFALLVVLQFVITWTSVRWSAVDRLVKAEPALLYHRGAYVRDAMKRERVTESEIGAAVREQGHADVGQVDAVILETDGSISVVARAG